MLSLRGSQAAQHAASATVPAWPSWPRLHRANCINRSALARFAYCQLGALAVQYYAKHHTKIGCDIKRAKRSTSQQVTIASFQTPNKCIGIQLKVTIAGFSDSSSCR